MTSSRNIAVYGGSFNPLHIGHLAIMKHLVDVAGFDAVYLVVSPKNPLKESISSDSARDRYNAAVEAVNRHFADKADQEVWNDQTVAARGLVNGWHAQTTVQGVTGWRAGDQREKARKSGHADLLVCRATRVRVDDIELNMPSPHYTIRTLEALKEREPENRFTLVMGADNLSIIRNWKDYSKILTDYGIAVFPREGYDMAQIKQDLLNENPAYKIQLLNAPLVTISSTQIREALSRGEDVSHLLM